MKFTFILILNLLIVFGLNAQSKNIKPDDFANFITENGLKNHLYYIAGPECEGRGTGTPGIKKAATYIENEFKKYGLLPGNGNSYQLEYTLLQDSIAESFMLINGNKYNYNDFFTATNRNNNTQKLIANEIVYVGYGISDSTYDDYKNIDVKNKIVLLDEGEPKINDTTFTLSGTTKKTEWSNFNNDKKAAAALKNGAIAIFINTKKYNKSPIWPQKRGAQYPLFKKATEAVNKYFLSPELLSAITNNVTLKKGMSIKIPIEINFNKVQFTTPSTNVIALLPGSKYTDQYVFITAHMDHLGKKDSIIYYGADDDGSGTCAVMQMAKAFSEAKKKGISPKRNIVFMTVSGEERGLWGSAYYTQNPVFNLDKTSVDLNIDMIGRVGSDYLKDAPDSLNYVYVIGDDKLSTELRTINEEANKKVNLKLDYRYNDPNDKNRFYYRSDHYNFAEKGVPIIFYFDGVHKDYHKPTDTPDKINYNLYMKRARLVFYTAWTMANKDAMLKRDIPLK